MLATILRCWWRFLSVSSPTSSIFQHKRHQNSKDIINIETLSTTAKNCHKHKVTNIHLSPTSMCPHIWNLTTIFWHFNTFWSIFWHFCISPKKKVSDIFTHFYNLQFFSDILTYHPFRLLFVYFSYCSKLYFDCHWFASIIWTWNDWFSGRYVLEFS